MAALALPALFVMLQIPIPRSVLIFDPLLLVMIMGGSRIAYRVWKEQGLSALTAGEREPVVIIGAEEAAVTLLKELARSPQWRAAGVFDDNDTLTGRQLQGVRILGKISGVPGWIEPLGVRHAIIAMPAASHGARRRAVKICTDAGLKVMTVPSYDDLVSGKVTVSQIRHVELDDLLGRDPVVLDTAGLQEWIHDRVIMVTGAGGSIGAELCRQLARFSPRAIVLFELSEFALYNVEQEFRRNYASIRLVCAIGDVKDRARMEEVMQAHRPSVVFHAAAYKHVPLMESENAWQAVLNNVAGTHVVADTALQSGVEKFVLISTDKAINPTSVMGATKRLAEMVCQALQQPHGTRFVMVRFGNVLGCDRQRDPEIPRANRRRRAGNRHAPGNQALFHVDSGGGPARAAGRLDGQRRRDPRAGHGRTGADCGPRARSDPVVGFYRRRHQVRLHRFAARGKTL